VQQLITFMNDYGYIVLFLSLILGIMALPIPIEALMGYAGFLAYKGQLNWFFSILTAATGCTLGAIFSYLIGHKLGMPFFEKYGRRIHLGPERLEKTSAWFTKYGNKLLFIAFFIPGVRHLTGYFSGITRLPIRIFAAYSSIGSVIWVSTFIFLGKILGPNWQVFHEAIKKYLIAGSITLAVVLIVVFLAKRYRSEITQTISKLSKQALELFRSRRRAELILGGISLVTICFIILMISIIQNFLSNEIQIFDQVTNLLMSIIFRSRADFMMNFFLRLGTANLLMSLIFYTLLWTVWKGRNKLLELSFLVLTVGGGAIYEEVMRYLFNRLSPSETPLLERFPYSFPSEQSLMAFVIYGFFFYILLRHSKSIKLHSAMIIFWIGILLLIGISRIYFQLQDPSQIAAGYVFGGVWLGIMILLLEIFRMLTNIDPAKKKRRIRPQRNPH
jgi:membrane protein DedA with SNARE-associated domain